MPLFDDVLKTIQNEQEVAAIRAALEKNPETKKVLDKFEAQAKDGENYLEWYKTEWPKFKDAPEVRTQLAAAQKTIEDLNVELKTKPAATPPEELDMGEMTTEQFNAAVQKAVDDTIKAQGFVTAAQAQQMADEASLKAASEAKARVYTHGLPLVERMIEVGRKYQADFGKPFDRRAFGEFIEKSGQPDIDKAYSEFTQEEYLNKTKAEAFAQGKIQGAKETEEKLTKVNAESAARSLPVDMTGSAGMPVTPGAAPVPVELDKVPEDYELGRKGGFRLAAAVAQKVKQDRAAGKAV